MPPYYRALPASKFSVHYYSTIVWCMYQTTIVENVDMHRYRSVRQICPRCNHGWTGDIPSAIMRLRKVNNNAVYNECTVLYSGKFLRGLNFHS